MKVTDEDADSEIIAASNWKIYPAYVKSDFDVKAASVDKMTAEDVTWHSDERQREDAVKILKKFFATRYRRTGEAHVSVVRIGFGIAVLSPFPKAHAMFSCYSAP